MDNKERLCLKDAITEAEIYAVKVIQDELKKQGIEKQSLNGRVAITRTADVLAHHREEVRDMYKKSKGLLAEWIIRESHIKDLKVFKKMQEIGFTGDVLKDMDILEQKKRHDGFMDAALYGAMHMRKKGGRR